VPGELPEVTAIILAGGRSSRLGLDKTELRLGGGETILESVVRKLKPLSSEVLIVSSRSLLPPPGVRMVPDIEIGKGSLRGIYSGLKAAGTEHSLVVACDMPFLNVPLLGYMLGKPRDYDVLVRRVESADGHMMVESLHAVYSRRCIPAIEALARSGSATIREFYPEVLTRYLDQNEIDALDPQHLSFFNINTPEDLAFARSIAAKMPHPG
jgi:molybdopterin-guanine dinucleotide biosynthesis protein A